MLRGGTRPSCRRLNDFVNADVDLFATAVGLHEVDGEADPAARWGPRPVWVVVSIRSARLAPSPAAPLHLALVVPVHQGRRRGRPADVPGVGPHPARPGGDARLPAFERRALPGAEDLG